MKTTKVYHAPGYPIDPKKEEQRSFERLDDYSCVMIPPQPILLQSQTVDFMFGSHEEAKAFLLHRTRALALYYEQKKTK